MVRAFKPNFISKAIEIARFQEVLNQLVSYPKYSSKTSYFNPKPFNSVHDYQK